MRAAAEFFQVGGTLSRDAPSYIERPADDELLDALKRHELCLVLAPRQTGKSSLMVHAQVRLGKEGILTGIVDLQPLGSESDPGRWFSDVAYQIERSLRLETDSGEWWEAHSRLSPTQRFMAFLEEVVLEEIPGDVVLFMDEVDSVLPLAFSDDFFTTVRSLYNARAQTPALERLTFVLLGVASPTSFVWDHTRTPFNVGVAIPLDDFDRGSIERLRAVLGPASDPLIDRIFHWTNGQPLLVQRLAAVAYGWPPEDRTAEALDREVEHAYLGRQIEQDTHLKFIRDFVLIPDALARETLDTYRKVLEDGSVQVNRQSPAQTRLRLSGLVRAEDGKLLPRNPIYEAVFDLDWVREHTRSEAIHSLLRRWVQSGRQADYLPRGKALEEMRAWADGRDDLTQDERDFAFAALEAGRREERQKVMRQRRLMYGLCLILLLLLALLGVAYKASERANVAAAAARTSAAKSKESAAKARASAERASRSEAQEKKAAAAAEAARIKEQAARRLANIAKLRALNAAMRERKARQAADAAARLARKAQEVAQQQHEIAVSRELAAYALQKLWDDPKLSVRLAVHAALTYHTVQAEDALRRALVPTQSAAKILTGHRELLWSAAFSPDGRRIVTASTDRTAKVWEAATGKLIATLTGHTGSVHSATFSPDGRRIVTAGGSTAEVWEAATGKPVAILTDHTGYVTSATFSPDGRRIVTASTDRTAEVWDAATGKPIATLTDHMNDVLSATFSPDGRRIVTASDNGTAKVWEAVTGKPIATFTGHTGYVHSAAFSPDGRRIVTASDDGTAKVWDAATGKPIATFTGHTGIVTSATFSPDGRRIVTASADRTAKVWEAATGKPIATFTGHTGYVHSATFSPDGRRIVTAGGSTAKVWEAATGKPVATLTGHTNDVWSAGFSPDGRWIVTASLDHTARLFRTPSMLSIDQLLALAEKRKIRVLTPQELRDVREPRH